MPSRDKTMLILQGNSNSMRMSRNVPKVGLFLPLVPPDILEDDASSDHDQDQNQNHYQDQDQDRKPSTEVQNTAKTANTAKPKVKKKAIREESPPKVKKKAIREDSPLPERLDEEDPAIGQSRSTVLLLSGARRLRQSGVARLKATKVMGKGQDPLRRLGLPEPEDGTRPGICRPPEREFSLNDW